MMSQRIKIIVGGVVVAISLTMVLSYGFLHDTLGLPSKTIGFGAACLLIAIVAGILWLTTLRDGSRGPERPNGRKTYKQRS